MFTSVNPVLALSVWARAGFIDVFQCFADVGAGRDCRRFDFDPEAPSVTRVRGRQPGFSGERIMAMLGNEAVTPSIDASVGRRHAAPGAPFGGNPVT
jgi:hypothetical protein